MGFAKGHLPWPQAAGEQPRTIPGPPPKGSAAGGGAGGAGGAPAMDDESFWMASARHVETHQGRAWLRAPKWECALSPGELDLGAVLCEEASDDDGGGGDDDWAPAPYGDLDPKKPAKKPPPAPRLKRATSTFRVAARGALAGDVTALRARVVPPEAGVYASAEIRGGGEPPFLVATRAHAADASPLELSVEVASDDERHLGSRRFWVLVDCRCSRSESDNFTNRRVVEEASFGVWCRCTFVSRDTFALVASVESLSSEARPWVPEYGPAWKSSTRLQFARNRTDCAGLFGSASRTRREQSIRPKIGQNDFDLAELENFKVQRLISTQVREADL